MVPEESNLAAGVAVPIPNLLLVSSQNKLALSCAIVVPLLNNTLPLVSEGRLNFPLNVDQSTELNTPLFVAEAVGTFKVITGVVVPVATVELKSVPVVPNVNAATLVTVPTLNVLSALKSCVVPLIVIERVVGTGVYPSAVSTVLFFHKEVELS